MISFILLALGCAPIPSTELYEHPWPDERLRGSDGTLDLSSFPRGTGAEFRDVAVAALEGREAFSTTASVLFPLSESLDPSTLPTPAESLEPGASACAVVVDPESSHFGEQALVDVAFLRDGGPFGGENLLVVLPYPGRPLRSDTLYAFVVTDAVATSSGLPLPPETDASEGRAHLNARAALRELGIGRVSRLAVLRTDSPQEELRRAYVQARSDNPVVIGSLSHVETHDGYCVFRGVVEMPIYQEGQPPYDRSGGGWQRDDAGNLILQRWAESRVWVTVPRREGTSFPAALLVRAGAGGDRPLVDRGPRDASGMSPPGTGLARDFADAGYIGVSVDGPLGGMRNPENWDEQTAIFNVRNPPALRDNVRQSALELALLVDALQGLTIDASACGGAPSGVSLQPEPVLVGHSTGATIAPLAAAIEPRFSALILSGAGASWIRQVVHKRSPAPMRPVAEMLFGYFPWRQLSEHDPLLGLMQWAGEEADPLVYAHSVRDRPVLVFQGVLDTYIPPPIANPLAMSLGLRLVGPAYDTELPFNEVLADLAFAPAHTEPRLLVQHPPDGIEDGHEILFQRADARAELRCFLRTLAEESTPHLDCGSSQP